MPVSQKSGKTILLVEDDRTLSNLYTTKLTFEKYLVLQAFDGLDALATLKKESNIDLILLDLRMPRMSGEVFLEKARKIPDYRDTPVIVLTNIGREEAPKTLWHLGINYYFVKAHHTPSELIGVIQKVFNQV